METLSREVLVSLVYWLIGLTASPVLLGVISRTKALFAGRVGPPLLQPYYDLFKLLQKGAVYSRTTSWIFRAGPVVGLAAVIAASAMVPLGRAAAPLHFPGDLLLVAYLLAVVRFFIVLAALDTGSSFEGMGATREATFSALAEPAFVLSLVTLARLSRSLSFSGIYGSLSKNVWLTAGVPLMLVVATLFLVLLAENARIPVDDPGTHLELTMIHEVMVLDHGGPDFALILYGAALKVWIFGSLIVGLFLPAGPSNLWQGVLVAFAGMIILAVLIGVVESCMARLRLGRIPQMLVGASVCSLLALLLVLR
jgi:formate hydrogenlyase subunit 4